MSQAARRRQVCRFSRSIGGTRVCACKFIFEPRTRASARIYCTVAPFSERAGHWRVAPRRTSTSWSVGDAGAAIGAVQTGLCKVGCCGWMLCFWSRRERRPWHWESLSWESCTKITINMPASPLVFYAKAYSRFRVPAREPDERYLCKWTSNLNTTTARWIIIYERSSAAQ
jgi:hypothetical protein